MREYRTGVTIDFIYDADGRPLAMKYNGTLYYYILNLQGDVIRLVNASGATVASYEYDPYGKVISATGSMASINPLRYRGYYYDQEAALARSEGSSNCYSQCTRGHYHARAV